MTAQTDELLLSTPTIALPDVMARLDLLSHWAQVDVFMQSLVASPVLEVSHPARYVISAGGKRLRAALVILAARLNRFDASKAIAVASAVELLHAASLVHDDMIDQSPRRRGLESVHSKWFRDAALVGGDYLFALSAQSIARSGDIRVLECLGRASVQICEGEISLVRDVMPLQDALAAYYAKIVGKTAVLFEEGLKAAGIVSGATAAQIEALGKYGRNLGMAFQMTDDVLDYVGDPDLLGKPVGGDLQRRQITLPLIYAANNGMPPFLRATIDRIDDGATSEEVADLLTWVQSSIGIEKSLQDSYQCCEAACRALEGFAPSDTREALEGVAWSVVARQR